MYVQLCLARLNVIRVPNGNTLNVDSCRVTGGIAQYVGEGHWCKKIFALSKKQ